MSWYDYWFLQEAMKQAFAVISDLLMADNIDDKDYIVISDKIAEVTYRLKNK